MTDQQRTDWLAGRWTVVRQYGYRTCLVRRQVRGKVQTAVPDFPDEKSAQRYADRRNAKEPAP